MERISKLIEKQPGELTKTKAGDLAGGQKQSRLHAAGVLLSEGFLSSERGRGGHDVLSSVKPYREADDPRSDRFLAGGTSSARSEWFLVPGSYTREPGNQFRPVPQELLGTKGNQVHFRKTTALVRPPLHAGHKSSAA
ncbi:hypothetical protein ACFQZK_05065 [Rhodococcus aetherivorans]